MTLTETLLAALLLAAAGSAHCLGMCGAISVGISFSLPEQERSPKRLLRWHLLVNAGRTGFYSLLGAISGALGATVQQLIPGGARIVVLFSALVLLLIGLQQLGQAQGLRWLEGAGQKVWRRVQPLTRPLLPLHSSWQALALGALWGLMPCALIYTALALAAGTTSAGYGALLMALFGAMTAIPVATTGVLAGSLSWLRQPRWRYLSALLCLLLAASMLWHVARGNGHQHPAADTAGTTMHTLDGAGGHHHQEP